MKKNKLIVISMAIVTFGSVCLTACESTSTPPPEEVKMLLCDEGYSSYQIVLPAEASVAESTAARELNNFLELSAKCTLPIIKDTGLTHDKNNFYISIGDTNVLKTSGISVDESYLGYSGYTLKTVDKSVFIAASTYYQEEGNIFGVYDFLNKTINYKAYAKDEIVYDNNETVYMGVYDETVVPSLPVRSIGFHEILSDNEYAYRMFNNVIGEDVDPLGGHSQCSEILPIEDYYNEHPEWFSNGGKQTGQLDWTNMEMRDEFVKKLIEKIKTYNNATFFNLGQADSDDWFEPQRMADINTWNECGQSYAGIQIDFVNYVVEKVQTEYIDIYEPGREICFVILAYHATAAPPVVKDEDGNYKPYSDRVIPNKRIYVKYAPVYMDFCYGFENEKNSGFDENLKGWEALAKGRINTHSYGLNYWNYLIANNNFGSQADIFRRYEEAGVFYFFQQHATSAETAQFEHLRIYCESQLLWDTSKTYEELAKEFIQVYYKEASSTMQEFYDTLRSWLTICLQEKGWAGGIYSPIGDALFWPKEVVDQLDLILLKALDDLEPLKQSDPEKYEKLSYRIREERVMTLFLKLKHYRGYYTDTEFKQLLDEFSHLVVYFNLTLTGEGRESIQDFINGLK